MPLLIQVLFLSSLQGAPPRNWIPSSGYRSFPIEVALSTHAGFSLQSPESTGLTFTNLVSRSHLITNVIALNGSGVAAGDMDGDGWCDLYFCSLEGSNALFRNLGGWRFENITAKAGVGCDGMESTGAAFADLDGDGDLDLIVNSMGHGTSVFLNDGHGQFHRIALLNPGGGGTSLALADIDGDGDLDLYIANYRVQTMRDDPSARFEVKNDEGEPRVVKVNGRSVSDPDLAGRYRVGPKGKILEDGEPDLLLLNDGKGNFTPCSFTDGRFLDVDGKALTHPPYDWGLSVMFRDLNQDGAPDLYVCNDFHSPDRIWINEGHGRFKALPTLSLRSTSYFSMGVDFADINRDGLDDFFVADMQSRTHVKRHILVPDLPAPSALGAPLNDRAQYPMNSMFLNRGKAVFSEIALLAGVNASDWSWSPVFLDVDLDGYEDLLITTGVELEMMNMDVIGDGERKKAEQAIAGRDLLGLRGMFSRMATESVAFRNRGDLTFEDVSAAWRFNLPRVAQGMALADLDNDGDLDVVINNMNDVASLLRNDVTAPRLGVRLKGKAPNTRGIGARLRVLGGPVTQTQEMISGGRYLSSDDAQRTFAAGAGSKPLSVEVTWRSGARSTLASLAPNQVVEISEETSSASPSLVPSPSPSPSPWFEDLSGLLNHRHQDEPFDELQRQPLLPRRLSQLGPGVAWSDFDDDGWEDLIVGAGRGGLTAVFKNHEGKSFSVVTNASLLRRVPRDQTGIAVFGSTVFMGASNYEDGQTHGGLVRVYDLKRGAGGDSILGVPFSTGPLALADVDGDGDLDVFVGGRCLAGRYPEPAASYLMRNDGGRLTLWHTFADLGRVSAAVFTDLGGKGDLHLVVACDWGGLRVFRALAKQPQEITESLGLAAFTGLWNGVTAGDLDGDGQMDLVASNWGWNHEMQQHVASGNRIFYGDFSDSGSVSVLESYFDPVLEKVVPYRNLMTVSRALPFIRERMTRFQQYGESSVAEILGDRFSLAREISVTTFTSTLFLNRGDHFEAHALPAEAQFAPAFGVNVADLDGDGREDVFLSQNFFGTDAETPRHAGGFGLVLQGDGRGGFRALPPIESGIMIPGEQRGSALADFDGDGRVDLVVTQNSDATRLFHNRQAKPGLRVKLRGGTGNPAAVGAVLQLEGEGMKSYAREIHAGSGYWSNDGAVQVMTLSEAPRRLRVRWPGGVSTVTELVPGAREVTVVAPSGGTVP